MKKEGNAAIEPQASSSAFKRLIVTWFPIIAVLVIVALDPIVRIDHITTLSNGMTFSFGFLEVMYMRYYNGPRITAIGVIYTGATLGATILLPNDPWIFGVIVFGTTGIACLGSRWGLFRIFVWAPVAIVMYGSGVTSNFHYNVTLAETRSITLMVGGFVALALLTVLKVGSTPDREYLDTRQSVVFACTVSIILGVVTWLTFRSGLPYDHWIPATILRLIVPSVELWRSRSFKRSAGTVAGAAAAALFISFVHVGWLCVALGTLLWSVPIIRNVKMERRTALSTASIILLSGGETTGRGVSTAVGRVEATIAGAIIVLASTYLIEAILRRLSRRDPALSKVELS